MGNLGPSTSIPFVLVVDDDAAMRMLIHSALEEQLGILVEEAGDGQEALDAIRKRLPDLVLLDVEMPVLDGFGVCSQLRHMPGGQDTSIVMITGLDDHASIIRAYELGATDFITKPINWPIFLQRVRYLLRARDAFRALRESEAQLGEAQRIARLGIWNWEIDAHRAQWSDELYRILGQTPGSVSPGYEAFLQAVDPRDRARVAKAIGQALASGKPYSIEHRVVRPDGSERTVQAQGEVVFDETGNPDRIRNVIQDISERKQAEARIYRLSFYDELTGLPNLELFQSQARQMLASGRRQGLREALVHLDLDRFKRINESLGHAVGDEALKVVADRIVKSVRSSDAIAPNERTEIPHSLARRGADEFVILVTQVRRSEHAANFAQRLLEHIGQPIHAGGQEIFITASAGIAVCPSDGETVDALVKNAGIAARHAKQAGGNGFRFYSRDMNKRALERLNLETGLNRALAQSELSLCFQPQMDLGSDHASGFEALLRWQPAGHDMVPPNQFIPIAEETGLIIPIGEWVLRAACAQLGAWSIQGYALAPIAVNISARQFTQPNLAQIVREALAAGAVEPCYLELELTETVIMHDPGASRRQLDALKKLGVRIAIDDFGTGYSSMSYLKRFPLDTLKIDRSFIADLSWNATDRDIVGAIIALAKSLNLATIAEGVETLDQRTILVELGCDRYQGFLASPPVPAGELGTFLSPAPVGSPLGGDLAEDTQPRGREGR